MKRMVVLIAVAATAISVKAEAGDWDIPAERERFHVFLLMGQSNMSGAKKNRPRGDDLKPVLHVLLLGHEIDGLDKMTKADQLPWKPAAHPLHTVRGKGSGFGLGLDFAEAYLKQHPGVTVGLIAAAKGGTRIGAHAKMPGNTKCLYTRAEKKARLAKEHGTIKGILWHQGESDTTRPERADSYEENLHRLISDIRGDVKIHDLPFVVGDLYENYGKGGDSSRTKNIERVRGALKRLPERVPHTAFVPSTGLKCTKDRVHFSKQALREFGKRYLEVYEKLTNK